MRDGFRGDYRKAAKAAKERMDISIQINLDIETLSQ